MKNKLKELKNKRVSFFHSISSRIHIGFDDDADYDNDDILEIDNGQNMWRMLEDGEVVASTRDIFIYRGDIEDCGYGVIDDLDTQSIETDDFDEYNEEVYDRLDSHRTEAIEKCNNLIKDEKVTDVLIHHRGDFEIVFSNGAIFQVFAMASSEKYSGITFI